ncbi:hypothetical protein [Corynebacterium sp.]|uniref:hypothetical protein n=1 Tax=Corynebacterium sp. TaxID=1720 RepID=UPI0028AEE470|nr:hypothetical protein [Corynebacterium sp.]
MTQEFRVLQQIHASVTPALPGRILAAVLISIFVGDSSSPVAGPWTLFIATPVLLIAAVYLGFSLRAQGMRKNEYAPMRADDRTASELGDTVEEPRSPNKKLRTLASFAVPGLYALMWIGQLINSATVGWVYAAAVTVIVLVCFWRAFVLEGAHPADYVPPCRRSSPPSRTGPRPTTPTPSPPPSTPRRPSPGDARCAATSSPTSPHR